MSKMSDAGRAAIAAAARKRWAKWKREKKQGKASSAVQPKNTPDLHFCPGCGTDLDRVARALTKEK